MRWDYVCSDCGQVVEMTFDSIVKRDTLERSGLVCPLINCNNGRLERQPAAPNFSVQGFSAKNGYSR